MKPAIPVTGDRQPWFTAISPFPWFMGTGVGRKRFMGVGNPQSGLAPQTGATGLNFEISAGASVGTNVSGSSAGVRAPATVGAVLNMSAAAIASGPMFARGYDNQG